MIIFFVRNRKSFPTVYNMPMFLKKKTSQRPRMKSAIMDFAQYVWSAITFQRGHWLILLSTIILT